jgi:hypothetical protein
MFSSGLKHEIAEKIQEILQKTGHGELPKGEITFILHVDGEWANIRNNGLRMNVIPDELDRNMMY